MFLASQVYAPKIAFETLDNCPLCHGTLGSEALATTYTDLWLNSDRHRYAYRPCAACQVLILANRPVFGPALGEFYATRGGCGFLDLKHRNRKIRAYTRSLQKRKIAILQAIAPVTAAMCVLEVGCAKGPFATVLAEEVGCEVHSNDLDASFGSNLPAAVTFHAGAFDAALFPSGLLFDRIICHHVIEHMYDPRLFLDTCHALLAPGGALVVETVNMNCATFRLFRSNWGLLCAPRHTVLFSDTFFGEHLKTLVPFREVIVRHDGYATSFSTLLQSAIHALHLPMAENRGAWLLGVALMSVLNPFVVAIERLLGAGRSVITVAAFKDD